MQRALSTKPWQTGGWAEHCTAGSGCAVAVEKGDGSGRAVARAATTIQASLGVARHGWPGAQASTRGQPDGCPVEGAH